MKKIIFLLAIFWSCSAAGETLTGLVRNINYESHSFGLEVPPLTRVYVRGTRFQVKGASATFQDVHVGDRVQVEGSGGSPGTFAAKSVTVLGNVNEAKDVREEVKTPLDQRFTLGVSQTALVQKDEKTLLKLHAEEFINTLCKSGGYNCSGDGEVGMRLSVDVAGKKNEILLTAKGHRKPTSPIKVTLDKYEIQLVEAGEDIVVLVVR